MWLETVSVVRKNKLLWGALVVFCAGIIFGLGVYLGVHIPHYHENATRAIRANSSLYTFTNPILECEVGQEYQNQEFKVLQEDIESQIDQIFAQNGVSKAAVYFRDLNNGPWFGINEDAEFSPASMLKVPIMIAWLKQLEDDPLLLQKKFTVLPEDVAGSLQQNIIPGRAAEVGKEYTSEQLLEYAIKDSDNISASVLRKNMPISYIEDVFAEIGVRYEIKNNDIYMTVKDYSAFFRILFNASYLDRSASEYALKLLSESSFKDGLIPGLDQGITVAHKYGERYFPSASRSESRQIHDCGIVYYPQRPYLLCVMTRGENVKSLEGAIQRVSALFYKEMREQFKTDSSM